MTRTVETQALYLREGRRHLSRARRLFPGRGDFEALLASMRAPHDKLMPRTVRRYKQELHAAVTHLIPASGVPEAESLQRLERLNLALEERRGKPAAPRATSLRVKDPEPKEVKLVLRHLLERMRGPHNARMCCMVGFYLTFAPQLGCRPVEWLGARIEADHLVVQSAKATNGADFTERRIGLEQYPAKFVEALTIFLELLPDSVKAFKSFEAWRKALAELLARSCAKVSVRRLCLYSFRHVALATWEKHGFTPWEIAALAGHVSTRTARAHYARGRHGWEAGERVAEPDADRAADLERRAASPKPHSNGSLPDDFSGLIETFPTPPQKADRRPATSAGSCGLDAWKATVGSFSARGSPVSPEGGGPRLPGPDR